MFSPANVYNVFILSVVIFISVYRYARVMYVCHQDSRESGSRHCLHKTVVGIEISVEFLPDYKYSKSVETFCSWT